MIMSKKLELPHCGQILTTKAAILDYMRSNHTLFEGLLYCAATGRQDSEYKTMLCSTCTKFQFLSKLVYRGKGDIVKLPAERYKKELFDAWMEDEEEISARLQGLNLGEVDSNFVYQCVQPIELLWCQMISCIKEQVFVSELAYAADYILARNGAVPAPEFQQKETDLFPTNYENFNYWEGDIVNYCNRIFSSF